MGDILSKLKMVSEKIGVTETAHSIEEQIDLISESLDKIPASTNIAEALDDLSEVAQNINNDEVYIDITITSFTASPSTAELGSSVNVNLAWTINKPPTYQGIDGIPVQGNSKQYAEVTATRTFTLSATDGVTTATKQATVTFANQIYYGVAADLSNVTSLSKILSNKKTRIITVDAGEGEYIIYAYPKRLGTVEFWVGQFEGGFDSPVEMDLKNSYGLTETYYVYKSENADLGETTIEIKEGGA